VLMSGVWLRVCSPGCCVVRLAGPRTLLCLDKSVGHPEMTESVYAMVSGLPPRAMHLELQLGCYVLCGFVTVVSVPKCMWRGSVWTVCLLIRM
jgi:hypothetical protein